MARGWKKIKVGEGHSVEAAVSYLADPQARGDYYTEGATWMCWLSTPRSRTYFALGDRVSRVSLAMLLSGRHPIDGQLIRRYGPDGTIVGGIDVTVNPAPKSVSILWALGDDELRAELEELVILSVNGAVCRMLDEVPLVRQRYGPGPTDVRHVRAQDWVGVQVLHTTARLAQGRDIPDPQLHVHNVLIGALDWAGRLLAIDTYPISLFHAELIAQASADLAERLRRRGWQIERRLVRDQKGRIKRAAWEVAGVPAELVEAMSRRRAEVDDLREQYRQATGREPSGPGWERFLEQHRGPKAVRTEYEMYAAWEEEAAEHGFGPEQVAAMKRDADAAVEAGIEVRDRHSEAGQQLRREILADICREHAFVPRRELNKFLVQRSMGLMHPYQAMGVVADMYGAADLLVTDDEMVTTLEVLAAEQRATAAAERLLEAESGPAADRADLEREFRRVEEEGGPFDERQRHAVELATSGARLVSITGPAGTGKGHASNAMAAIWQRQGRRVIAGAIQGITAQQAEADSGADQARTLAGLRWALDTGSLQLQPSDVLLVDEAGMIDHHNYAALLEAVADAGATLVQVGDDKQLSPVEAGGLWTVIHGMAAARDRAVELREVRRARDPREAQAWTDLREGRVIEALTWYRDEGLLRLYDTRQELLRGMLEEWWSAPERGVMVVDSSNEERDRLNGMAQARRQEAGELGAEALLLENGRELRAGDRVLFHAIYRPEAEPAAAGRPKRVENGTAATVVSVDLVSGTARLQLHEPHGSHANGLAVDRELAVPAMAPIELGYARHVFKAQGMTADVANVAVGPHTRHNELYTMVTRSRNGTRIHALRAELEEMGADIAHLEPGAAEPAEAQMTIEEYLRQPDLLAELRAARRDREHLYPAEMAILEPRTVAAHGDREHLYPAEMAALERQRASEDASIRETAKRANRSSSKQAIGARTLRMPALEQDSVDVDIEVRSTHLEQHDRERRSGSRPVDEREMPARVDREAGNFAPPRRPTLRPVRAEPLPQALPARDPIESLARVHARDRDTVKMLAYYEVLGRRHLAAEPAEEAVRLWQGDRDAVIVVCDQEQEQLVHAAVSRIQEEAGPAASADDPPTAPRIVQAATAYGERHDQREAWRRETGAAGHGLEPDAVPRAYVVVPDLNRHGEVVQGLSAAAQAHLITPSPNTWTEIKAQHAAREIREGIAARVRAESLRQTASAAELAAAHDRDREVEAERGRARQAERI